MDHEGAAAFLAAAEGGALLAHTLPDGSTPLHMVCTRGAVRAAQELLVAAGAGADALLLAQTEDGSTCLHNAADFWQLATVEWL